LEPTNNHHIFKFWPARSIDKVRTCHGPGNWSNRSMFRFDQSSGSIFRLWSI